MNPYLQIINQLHQKLQNPQQGQPLLLRQSQPVMQNVMQRSPQLVPSKVGTQMAQQPLGGGIPGMPPPQGHQFFGPQAQPNQQQTGGQRGEPMQNPYMALLQQRMELTGNKGNPAPFLHQGDPAGQQNTGISSIGPQQNVMTGNFNAQNLIIPTPSQIPANLAQNPVNQGEGDMVK